jgi:uncharacterized membrane protein YhiD involved in acid resistance
MIQGLIVKWIFNAIYKAIKRKHDLKKIDNYVNKPNELDKQMKQVQKNLNKALKYIEELEKEVGILKADSHPPLFTKKDKNSIERRLKKLEKKEK